MLAFKNRTGKLVIVCDYDETVASKFCTTLVERGYDNVFMLSGGSFANLEYVDLNKTINVRKFSLIDFVNSTDLINLQFSRSQSGVHEVSN